MTKGIARGQNVPANLVQRARELRKEMTPAERKLWSVIRRKQALGWRFRRQQVIEGYIVDFYCPQRGLVIEVDGDVHAATVDQDAARDTRLHDLGLRVVRFTNPEVMYETEAVEARLTELLGPK